MMNINSIHNASTELRLISPQHDTIKSSKKQILNKLIENYEKTSHSEIKIEENDPRTRALTSSNLIHIERRPSVINDKINKSHDGGLKFDSTKASNFISSKPSSGKALVIVPQVDHAKNGNDQGDLLHKQEKTRKTSVNTAIKTIPYVNRESQINVNMFKKENSKHLECKIDEDVDNNNVTILNKAHIKSKKKKTNCFLFRCFS